VANRPATAPCLPAQELEVPDGEEVEEDEEAMKAMWRQVTSWNWRFCRPRYPSRNSGTVCCPSPGTRISSVRSSSCDNINPSTVHAAGSAQYPHRHQIRIICIHCHPCEYYLLLVKSFNWGFLLPQTKSTNFSPLD
jgi:hypothetical protein